MPPSKPKTRSTAPEASSKKAETPPSERPTFDYDEAQAEADKSFLEWAKQNGPPQASSTKEATASPQQLTFDYDVDQAESDKRLAEWIRENAPFKWQKT